MIGSLGPKALKYESFEGKGEDVSVVLRGLWGAWFSINCMALQWSLYEGTPNDKGTLYPSIQSFSLRIKRNTQQQHGQKGTTEGTGRS